MKGIILAGGSGTRLYPITKAISKQLMPIYNKPMIYYPLAVLMAAGIREVLLITTPRDQQAFWDLLGDGSAYGCSFSYAVQLEPRGLAEAFVIGENFIGNDKVCLILGDNIFYGDEVEKLARQSTDPDGGIVFAYHVSDPWRYGVVEFDAEKRVVSIEEKPEHPKSNFAIPGIYFYDNSVTAIARNLKPSARLEYEITDVNAEYLRRGLLQVQVLDKGVAWLDTGTFDSMMQACSFVEAVEKRQGIQIGCIEEIAYRMGYIDSHQLEMLARQTVKSGYGEYLLNLLKHEQIMSSLKSAAGQYRQTAGLEGHQVHNDDIFRLKIKKDGD